MSKTKSMDDYIRETRSYALQFEASGFKKNAEFMYDLADYLKSLPTPAVADTNVGGKWIPCSERLPDKSGYYLTFTKKHNVMMLPYSEVHREFNAFDSDDESFCSIECCAWQPLPEAYKGEQE